MVGRKKAKPRLNLGYKRLNKRLNSEKQVITPIGRFLVHTYMKFWMSYDELKGDLKYWKRKIRKKDASQTELVKYMKGLKKEIKELNQRMSKLGMGNKELGINETIGERLSYFEILLDEQINSLKAKNMDMRGSVKVMGRVIDSFEEIIDAMKDLNVTKEAGFTMIKAHNKATKKFFIFPGETPFTSDKESEINRIIEKRYNKGITMPYDIYRDLCAHYGVEPYSKDVIDKYLERKRY